MGNLDQKVLMELLVLLENKVPKELLVQLVLRGLLDQSVDRDHPVLQDQKVNLVLKVKPVIKEYLVKLGHQDQRDLVVKEEREDLLDLLVNLDLLDREVHLDREDYPVLRVKMVHLVQPG